MKERGLGAGGWGLGVRVGLGIFVLLGSVSFGQEPKAGAGKGGLRITVRVEDYAEVPRRTLAGAEQEATRILEETGIETRWLDCGGATQGFAADPECAKPFAPTDVLLRVLPRTMAERIPLTDSTFGFALQSTDHRLAFAAAVFYHRVEELAEKLGFSRAQILGYIMAHEIGHLLLRTMVHSPSGIMRASLSREDLLRPLGFTGPQGELIRADVAARVELEETSRLLTATSPK